MPYSFDQLYRLIVEIGEPGFPSDPSGMPPPSDPMGSPMGSPMGAPPEKEEKDKSKEKFAPTSVIGSDIKDHLIEWCGENLSSKSYEVNGLGEIDVKGNLTFKSDKLEEIKEFEVVFGTVDGDVNLRNMRALEHLEGFPKKIKGSLIDLRGLTIDPSEVIKAVPEDFEGTVVGDEDLEKLIEPKWRN